MALQSSTDIYIAGNSIPAFQEFNLYQDLGVHHTFELVCRMDVLEKATFGSLADDSKNYLGETLTFQVSSIGEFSGYKTLEFKGVVTSINSLKAFNHKNGDLVIISGYSTTILAEDGPHYASHNDVTLQDILEKTFAGYDTGKLETAFEPYTTSPLHYCVQSNESSWHYAARLASQYSEWFYFNGKKLVFGAPEEGEAIPLTYGHDLQEFSLELNPQPNKFNYFTNDYLTGEQYQKNTSGVAGANGYNGFSSEKASKLYSKETNVFINSYNDPQLKKRLDKQVEQQKKVAEQRQVILKGVSDNPGVGLGKVINIKGQDEHFGSYRVTKVSHTANENGRYQNTFEAVSAEIDVYPLTNFNAIPKSETQTAVVTENADPEGIGRIKVQFPWQKMMGEMTPWLRIVSPHAGGDKGFHFIPEIEEEVLVGFEGGNAERPYVMGSLYNGSGKATNYMNPNNDVKAIQTRSGNRVIMNDKDGSITMADPSGNTVVMHGNGEVSINAPNKLTINTTDFVLNAGNSIALNAQPGENGGEGTIAISAKKTINATADTEGITIDATTMGVAITGKEDVKIESTSAAANLSGSTKTTIKGADIAVNGGTTIKINSSDTDIS